MILCLWILMLRNGILALLLNCWIFSSPEQQGNCKTVKRAYEALRGKVTLAFQNSFKGDFSCTLIQPKFYMGCIDFAK